MGYTPTTWHGGDVLSAEAMNKIEQGIASMSQALIVEISQSGDVYTLNQTFGTIKQAFLNGQAVIVVFTVEWGLDYHIVQNLRVGSTGGTIEIDYKWFSADTDNNYPSYIDLPAT